MATQKKILVTGSQGTLGKKLVGELEARGHEVWGADLMHGEGRLVRTDISEARQVASTFEMVKPEVVYHLAAEFGRMNGQHYYEQLWKHNCIGTRNIIDACSKSGVHLVFASSSEAYGDAANLGALEEDILLSHVPSFHNEYALTKWTNEKQIDIAVRNDNLKATILRFFNAYGPGEYYTPYRSVVTLFGYRLMKGLPITVYKDYHRVFMYVGDWVRTVANVAERIDVLEKVPQPQRVYNIGGEEYRSIEELVEMIVERLGGTKSEITYLPKEAANIQNKRPSIARAKEVLGHECRVSLAEGLDSTIAWLKEMYK